MVRLAAIRACLPILNFDRAAARIFLLACRNQDALLASREVSDFLRYALPDRDELAPLLERMARSARREVAVEGASWTAARWIGSGGDRAAVDRVVERNAACRSGVALAASHNAADSVFAARCAELLDRLVDDHDEEVQDAVKQFLSAKDVLRDPTFVGFAGRFARGTGFERAPSALVDALRAHPDSLLSLAPPVGVITAG